MYDENSQTNYICLSKDPITITALLIDPYKSQRIGRITSNPASISAHNGILWLREEYSKKRLIRAF